MIPYIPDDAPFSIEQRAWLNGFLANLFATAPEESAGPAKSLAVDIYFASQSGTAERLAKKLSKLLKISGHVPTVRSVEKLKPVDLCGEKTAIFFASTYGEGDPPDSAKQFRDEIFAEGASQLQGLRYAIFCLGDSNYEQFCKFGVDLDERLLALGGTRIAARIESDVDVDAPFEKWQQQVLDRISSASESAEPAPELTPSAPEAAMSLPIHTRDNPYHAELSSRVALTKNVSSKLTMHVAFNLGDSAISYESGDACGVIAQNDSELVEELFTLFPFQASTKVTLPKIGEVTIHNALLHHLQPTKLTRKMVQAFAAKADCANLGAMLTADQSSHLDAYMYDRGLVDLLHDYPGVVTTPDELVAMLPKLAPRLYSISSSPAAHGRELHCTIAVVRYRSHNRERGGIASTMLAERVELGSRIPIYIQPNKRFRLPKNEDTPIVMIGPGTGIAPFRAFLHERKARGSRGKNWLFFGERSAQSDFLYCCELKQLAEDGYLSRLDTAFSRDQAHKVYVQDRMLEAGAELWQWLEDGAQLYVCGDASRMAKDVHAALHRVVETHGAMTTEDAQEYVSKLQEDHRYHRDVY